MVGLDPLSDGGGLGVGVGALDGLEERDAADERPFGEQRGGGIEAGEVEILDPRQSRQVIEQRQDVGCGRILQQDGDIQVAGGVRPVDGAAEDGQHPDAVPCAQVVETTVRGSCAQGGDSLGDCGHPAMVTPPGRGVGLTRGLCVPNGPGEGLGWLGAGRV